jgi:hypothetical protein
LVDASLDLPMSEVLRDAVVIFGDLDVIIEVEPPWVCRRLVGLS